MAGLLGPAEGLAVPRHGAAPTSQPAPRRRKAVVQPPATRQTVSARVPWADLPCGCRTIRLRLLVGLGAEDRLVPLAQAGQRASPLDDWAEARQDARRAAPD